jgi:hypothetical protein
MCDRVGCKAEAEFAPVIELRKFAYFKDKRPWRLIMGLELCATHMNEDEGPNSSLINLPWLAKLNAANMRTGQPAYDLTLTTVTRVPLASEDYQTLKGFNGDSVKI